MTFAASLAVVAGLVAFATALGLVLRARSGRVTHRRESAVSGLGIPFGDRATLLQFTTEVCAVCRPAAVVLARIAGEFDGVDHVEFDLTHRPDVAARLHIMQTPTTFVLDADGEVRARIGGAPRPELVRDEIDGILAGGGADVAGSTGRDESVANAA